MYMYMPELTVEAIIDAGPGGILARIQSKFTMPAESSVHGAQVPGPGEFCPKTSSLNSQHVTCGLFTEDYVRD